MSVAVASLLVCSSPIYIPWASWTASRRVKRDSIEIERRRALAAERWAELDAAASLECGLELGLELGLMIGSPFEGAASAGRGRGGAFEPGREDECWTRGGERGWTLVWVV